MTKKIKSHRINSFSLKPNKVFMRKKQEYIKCSKDNYLSVSQKHILCLSNQININKLKKSIQNYNQKKRRKNRVKEKVFRSDMTSSILKTEDRRLFGELQPSKKPLQHLLSIMKKES